MVVVVMAMVVMAKAAVWAVTVVRLVTRVLRGARAKRAASLAACPALVLGRSSHSCSRRCPRIQALQRDRRVGSKRGLLCNRHHCRSLRSTRCTGLMMCSTIRLALPERWLATVFGSSSRSCSHHHPRIQALQCSRCAGSKRGLLGIRHRCHSLRSIRCTGLTTCSAIHLVKPDLEVERRGAAPVVQAVREGLLGVMVMVVVAMAMAIHRRHIRPAVNR